MATNILYGLGDCLKPDLWRTDFAVIIGANPILSHSSTFSEPLTRSALDAVIQRRGRVLVIDPRRTETARRYEHLSVKPGTDAFLLLAIIRTLFDEDLVDWEFVNRWTSGVETFRDLVGKFGVDECAARCNVGLEILRDIARGFARARGAVIFGRTGTCTQRFGTLNNVLQDAINILTGNIERPGRVRRQVPSPLSSVRQ